MGYWEIYIREMGGPKKTITRARVIPGRTRIVKKHNTSSGWEAAEVESAIIAGLVIVQTVTSHVM